MSKHKCILGLDVGFCNTGYAVYRSDLILTRGCISTEKDQDADSVTKDNLLRCAVLAQRVGTIMDEHSPDLVVGEFPHGGAQNAKACFQMALAFGTIASLCSIKGLPVYSVTPAQIKRLVSANPRQGVSKEEVIEFVARKYGERVIPQVNKYREHVADAIAAITVYLNATGDSSVSVRTRNR